MKSFQIKENHLKLLKRMWISWDGCEFGAPAVDCKRPYGNSDVYCDIAEILGWTLPDFDADEDWSKAERYVMDHLHKEMKTVLQIGVNTGSFEIGLYENEPYSNRWKKVG